MLYAFLKNLIHPPTRALAFPWFWPLTPLSRGCPEDFPMKINNTSQQLHTQQIHLGFRDGSFPQNHTCSRKTTHQINTWSKTLNAKQHGYWSPDRSWACVTVPRRNNHFSQPCVHMRCHTSGQGWSWLLRADVGRGNYLDTVASAWECGESNTIWTWIWSTLLHAGGGKAGRVMEYLISTDGSNTVGLIPGCRTSQPSFFFITLMPKRFSRSDSQHRLRKIQDCTIWAVSTMTSGTIFETEGRPLKEGGQERASWVVSDSFQSACDRLTAVQKHLNSALGSWAADSLFVSNRTYTIWDPPIPTRAGCSCWNPDVSEPICWRQAVFQMKKINNGKASICYFKLINA